MATAQYLGASRGIECGAEQSLFGSEDDSRSADVEAKPTLAELEGRNTRLLLLPDPTDENRWNEIEIRAFCETAVELRRRLCAGEKILVPSLDWCCQE